MLVLEKIRNYFRLYQIKKNELIATCIKNNIPLTDRNVKEVEAVLKHNSTRKKSKIK